MQSERWGTLSVRDHLNTEALVADLLLYDRLVFPVFIGPDERTRWRSKGWDPDLQEGLIERLGSDVTVRVEWDEDRQQRYQDLRSARQQISEDAFQPTRLLLAMDQYLPEGIQVRAVAAYHDEQEAQRDLGLSKPQPDNIALGKLAFVVGQELLMPIIERAGMPEDLILRARDLSLKPSFRTERREFYQWQEASVDQIALGRKTVHEVVNELRRRTEALNHPIREYFANNWKSLGVKSVLTVIGISLPSMLGIHTEAAGLIGLVPGAFELVKFGADQAVDAGSEERTEAAAMIVSAGALEKGGIRRLLPWN
jgi:hypothetical protein